jgi:hypothetical protein
MHGPPVSPGSSGGAASPRPSSAFLRCHGADLCYGTATSENERHYKRILLSISEKHSSEPISRKKA